MIESSHPSNCPLEDFERTPSNLGPQTPIFSWSVGVASARIEGLLLSPPTAAPWSAPRWGAYVRAVLFGVCLGVLFALCLLGALRWVDVACTSLCWSAAAIVFVGGRGP